MITSVKERQKGAYDFKTYYEGICELQNVAPVPAVTCHLAEGILDINVDRIRTPDWDPIIKSLRINKNLNFIAFRSFWRGTNGQVFTENRFPSYRRPTPALLSSATIKRTLCRAVRSALRISTTLSFLELQNIPLNVGEITCICEGISKNRTIRHLSFEGSSIGDSGLEYLCRAIRSAPDMMTLNLTACQLTYKGIEHLTELIQFQALQRHGAAWADSLRYRHPNLDQLGGLRRITLSDNPGIGDAGAIAMAESLADDLWVKAVDMQSCELTDASARVWLNILIGPRLKTEKPTAKGNAGNCSLYIVDLRRNPFISRDLLRAVTERALMNGEGKKSEYNWLRAGPKAPTQLCSGVVVYPWPGIAGFDMHHLRVQTSSRKSGSMETPDKGQRTSNRHQSLGSHSARSDSKSRFGLGEKAGVQDGRVTGRPVFIPAGGKPRSRSLVSRGSRYCSTRSLHCNSTRTNVLNSGPPAVRVAWRPAGNARPKTAPQLVDQRTKINSVSGGIPWRAAARASRCCRGYPSHQHPGQTCLEARALLANVQCADAEVVNEKNVPLYSMQTPKLQSATLSKATLHSTSNTGWIKPNETLIRPLITANRPSQKAQTRLQSQVKKLMMRVAQLEIQLNKERQKSRTFQELKPHQKTDFASNQLDVIQTNAVERLNEFVQRLEELVENLNENGIIANHQESHLEQLRFNLHRLCALVDQSTSGTAAELSSTPHTIWTTGAHGDRRNNFNHNTHMKWIADTEEFSKNVVQEKTRNNGICNNFYKDQYCVGQSNEANVNDDTKSQFTSATKVNWEKYTETKAAQTSTDDSIIQSKINNENCSTKVGSHTMFDSSNLGELNLQVNNHNSYLSVETNPKISQMPDLRERTVEFEGSSNNTRTNENSNLSKNCVDISEHIDSLSHLEKLSSEANQMYADLKAATRVQESKSGNALHGTENIKPIQEAYHGEGAIQNENSDTSSDISTDKLLKAHNETNNNPITNQSDSDEELISDEDESIKLWYRSEKSTPRGQDGAISSRQTTSKTKSNGFLNNGKRQSPLMDDTELTIRENLFEISDEDLDELLIDYTSGSSVKDNNEDGDDEFIDFSDLAFSSQNVSNNPRLSVQAKQNLSLDSYN